MATIETTKTATDVTVKCGEESVTVCVTAMAQALLYQAAVHGVGQKLVDAAALSRNPENGQPASPAEKWARVKAMADRLNSGLWNAPVGERAAVGGMLFRAVAEVFAGTPHVATAGAFKEWVAAKAKAAGTTDAAYRAKLAMHPRVKPVLDRMAAAAAGSVDVEADMAELDS